MATAEPSDWPDASVEADGKAGNEEAACRRAAEWLGLPFVSRTNRLRPVRPGEESRRNHTIAMDRRGGLVYLAPDENAIPEIRYWLNEHPAAAKHLVMTTRSAIRAGLAAASYDPGAEAIDRLANLHPVFSARVTATRAQILTMLLVIAGLAALLLAAPRATLVTIGLFATAFFLGISLLRLIAAEHLRRPQLSRPRIRFLNEDALPVYTILVPLLREERMVPGLVAALDGLVWPADRLDIKLIVEDDDIATRRAAERAIVGRPYEIVVVPKMGPRTKPKALVYALAFARGSLVTVYDAEDRPDPMQLREAHAAFAESGPELACLQAPLVIDNAPTSAIARHFAVEYSALFDGLLPALAAIDLPLPLGGTSNHFRREALDRVGGWDPFNVTEDADLGIRLARFGYKTATISLPTYEEAPSSFRPWLNQRARWFKGWIQTWLVHTRQPARLIRELGLRQFVGFALVGIGMVLSAIIHPVYLATLAFVVADPLSLWEDDSVLTAALVGVNIFNLFAGYFAVMLLSWRTLSLRGRRRYWATLLTLPIYWLLMSIACVRAFGQLVRRPHHWDKTPHRGRVVRARREARAVVPRLVRTG